MTERAEGQVFDLGYRRYEGPREGRGRARFAVFKDGIRTCLGIGRGGRAKIVPWLFIVAAIIPALVMALVAGTVDRLAPGASVNLPSYADYYGIAAQILLIFGAVVAPELLSGDRRSGVVHLYLVRPLTALDYAGARWAAFFAVMLVTTWVPQLVLLTGLTLGANAPLSYLEHNWLDIPRFLAAGVAISLFVTTLAMTVASFTSRRAYAAVFIVGLFVVSLPFAEGVSHEVGQNIGKWIALLNLANVPLFLNDMIFNHVSNVTQDSPARALGNTILVGWYLVWTVGPGAVLWWRFRQ